jgi:hypothetical protein
MGTIGHLDTFCNIHAIYFMLCLEYLKFMSYMHNEKNNVLYEKHYFKKVALKARKLYNM